MRFDRRSDLSTEDRPVHWRNPCRYRRLIHPYPLHRSMVTRRLMPGSEDAAPRSSPAASSVIGQKATNVSFHFHQNHGGPVFGQPPTTAPYQHQHAEPQRPAPSMWGLLAMVNNLMSLLGFGRPPQLAGVSTKNNEQLAQMLFNNFDAFRDPKKPSYVSLDSIRTMSKKAWTSDPVMNQNILLAREMLKRPALMRGLDQDKFTGAQDGLISLQNLAAVSRGDTYFKYKSDKELVGSIFQHFNELKMPGAQHLQISDLARWAAEPLMGKDHQDDLIQMAREILKRSQLLENLNAFQLGSNGDTISLSALYHLSR
ncbi:type III secretion effector protein [Pseudomonas trivialis]|uniref:type III secretion effector protein n=1 Tax=Pseudomonas trivialis TaxID=200450 RepID=UPI0030D4179D